MWRQLPNGRVVHRFEPLILGLALLVLPVVLIETSDAGEPWKLAAAVANWLIWVGFTLELLSSLRSLLGSGRHSGRTCSTSSSSS